MMPSEYAPLLDETQQHSDRQELIWAPNVIDGVDKAELDLYVRFSSTPCIPGGGCDVEEALDILYHANGDIKLAMKKLLQLNTDNQAIWTHIEVQLFERLIMLHGKNFYLISKDLQTKSVKECVQFYYLWKKSSFRNRYTSPLTTHSIASNSSQQNQHHTHNIQQQPHISITPQTSNNSTTTNNSINNTSGSLTATPSSSTSDESRDSGRGDSLLSINEHTQYQQSLLLQQQEQQFPCKVCGRVFMKIKSRSAHMKRHKNERLYSAK